MSSWFFCMLYKKYLHFTLMNYLLTHIGIHECISICNESCDVLFNVILCNINEVIWSAIIFFLSHSKSIFTTKQHLSFFPWIIYRIFLISCGKFYFFLVSQKELKTEKAESKVFFSILYSKGT